MQRNSRHYFAYRKTIHDNTDWGEDLTCEGVLIITEVVNGKVNNIIEPWKYIEDHDDRILQEFLTRTPGFRRRKEKILHLITDEEELSTLLWTLHTEFTIDTEESSWDIETRFDWIWWNHWDNISDLSDLCNQLGINAVENWLIQKLEGKEIVPLICSEK